MWFYNRILLCPQRPKESVFSHVIKRETSFHIGVHRQHDGYHICFHGASQLYPLRFLFCATSFSTSILCYFLLSWWIYWTEVHLIISDLFTIKMLRQIIGVNDTKMLIFSVVLPLSKWKMVTKCSLWYCTSAGNSDGWERELKDLISFWSHWSWSLA